MIKRRRTSRRTKPDHPQTPISYRDGKDKIVKLGIQPFHDRIDNYNNPYDWSGQTSIPQQQYIATYDTIFTMCIQRESHNYSKQLYHLNTELLKDYFINKKSINNSNNVLSYMYNTKHLEQWIEKYQNCQLTISGHTRMFMYLDRFYVPNTDNADNTLFVGLKLFYTHIFDIEFPFIRNKLLECINECRDDFNNDNHYFHQETQWLIMSCIQTVKLLNTNHNFYEKARDFLNCNETQTEFLVNGYVREFENKMNENNNNNYKEFIVPTQIIKIILYYKQNMNYNIFDRYFYNDFIGDTINYYSFKSKEWINNSNMSVMQYIDKCRNIIQYEMEQLDLWGISIKDKLKLKYLISTILFDKQTIRKIYVELDSSIKIAIYLVDIYKILLNVYNDKIVFVFVFNLFKQNINEIFITYIKESKNNKFCKDIYVKYKLIYDAYYIYQCFNKLSIDDNDKIKKKVNNMICNVFRNLLDGSQHKWHFIVLIAKFTNYLIRNSKHMVNIDNMMEFIACIFRLIIAYDIIGKNHFHQKYAYFMKRRQLNSKYISPHFEKIMWQYLYQ